MLEGAKKESSGCGMRDGPFCCWRTMCRIAAPRSVYLRHPCATALPLPLEVRASSRASKDDSPEPHPSRLAPRCKCTAGLAPQDDGSSQSDKCATHAASLNFTPHRSNESPDTAHPFALAASSTLATLPTLKVNPH